MQDASRIVIYADHRESGCPVLDVLRSRCVLKEAQLPVGDYLISDTVAVERKTTSDFLQSMIDGRLFRQLEELKSQFEHPLLLLEGNGLFSLRDIHPNAVRGALASIALDYRIPIIWTDNPQATAFQLLSLAHREQTEKRSSVALRGVKKPKAMEELQEFLISGFPKISRSTARKLLVHFSTPEKLFTATEKDLQHVDGIGKTLAKKIRLILSHPYAPSTTYI